MLLFEDAQFNRLSRASWTEERCITTTMIVTTTIAIRDEDRHDHGRRGRNDD